MTQPRPALDAPGPSSEHGIRVTATDLDTGDEESIVIWDDYNIVVAGSCYIAHAQVSANGTHVLTIKGRKERPRPVAAGRDAADGGGAAPSLADALKASLTDAKASRGAAGGGAT
jgi:hypothetical protein